MTNGNALGCNLFRAGTALTSHYEEPLGDVVISYGLAVNSTLKPALLPRDDSGCVVSLSFDSA